MKYICDLCNKTYTTAEEASQCEINCRNEKEKEMQLKAEKHERFDKIIEHINAYNKDYGTNYKLISVSNSSFNLFSLM